MTSRDIVRKALRLDRPTLAGFSLETTCDAVHYRLAVLAKRGAFDRHFAWKTEILILIDEEATPEKHFYGEHSLYLVFSDESLYLHTNGQDEVWADVRDFIQECLLEKGLREAEEFDPESAEGRLIREYASHLL